MPLVDWRDLTCVSNFDYRNQVALTIERKDLVILKDF